MSIGARTIRWRALAALCGVIVAGSAWGQWHRSTEAKQLYENARREGKVVLWGLQQRDLDWEQKAFEALFPGIRIEWYADFNVPTKAIAEARAGRHSVDVFHLSLGSLIPLAERGLLGKMEWSQFGLAAADTAFDARAGFTHNLVYTFAFNTQRVRAAELPKTWEDLLDPRWRGRLAASQFLLPRLVGTLGLVWGEQKAIEFARGLIAADVLITRAPRESFLQSGERVGAIGEPVNSVRLWETQGLPIGHVIPSPVGSVQIAVAVAAGAPHPHAARLLAGWMVSAEGKRARDQLRFDIDVRPGSEHPTYLRLKEAGAAFVYETPENMIEREALFKKVIPIVAQQQ